MKGAKLLSLFLVGCVFAGGCACVNRSNLYNGIKVEDEYEPLESVEVENASWILFGVLPLGGGDPLHPNENKCRWFEETTSLQNNLLMLDGEMRRVKAAKVANLTSRIEDENFFFVLLKRKTCHTSAILLEAKGSADAPSKKERRLKK